MPSITSLYCFYAATPNTSSKGVPVTSLWHKPPTTAMDPYVAVHEPSPLTQTPAPITQAYMDGFLQERHTEISSLKTKLKSCVHDLKRDVNGLGERVNDLEHTLDSCTKDQEALWCTFMILEDQQIELKQEDLESRRNNIRIRGIPKGQEGTNIMTFMADLLHMIRSEPDVTPPMLDRAYLLPTTTGHADLTLDILTRVHFYTEKEAILQASQKKKSCSTKAIQFRYSRILWPPH
ncbi:hypothetical protein NDU88_001115 [Pleurodeles waltl]|uniref:Uncharacterized protein n=1 Tax=Pleurodeles waltl TaxID=8319 RepID=A0AAV7S6J3_PLEWA|nr:hypothetical protein NDU88_001115 [Pleurodeles waltl]